MEWWLDDEQEVQEVQGDAFVDPGALDALLVVAQALGASSL